MKSRTCPICGYSLEQDVESEIETGAGRAAYPAALQDHFRSVHPDFWAWEQSKKRLGVGLGIVTAILTGIGLFYLFAIVLGVGQYAGRALVPLIFASFILPYALITRRGAEHFKAQWIQEGKGLLSTPTGRGITSPDLVTAPSSTSILTLANDLDVQLNLPNTTFSSLEWRNSIPSRQSALFIPGDAPVFRSETIYLAESIRDKLSIDDLRPLIASALIRYRGLKSRKTRSVLTLTLPTVALYVVAWFVLPPLFPTTTSCANGQCAINNWAWDGLIIGGPLLAIGLMFANILSMRKFEWVADKETAAIFGKEQLIASLQKVSSASPSDTQTIQQRIAKLQNDPVFLARR